MKIPTICFIDQTGALGGAEHCLLDIATCFKERCKVVLFQDGPFRTRLEERGVKVLIIAAPITISDIKREGGFLRELMAVPDIIRFALKITKGLGDSDVIFANTQKAFVIGCVAGVLSGKPLIWYLHDVMTADHFGRTKRIIDVFLANYFAKAVIANSNASRDAFYASGGNKDRRVEVVYNGIDAELFKKPDTMIVDRLRAQLGLNGSPVVAIFSRLAQWKGQHVLLEALTRLPGVSALVVGGALFSGEKAYEEKLKSYCREHNMDDRVRFLGFREDIPALMHLSDVVVHTSVNPEPFGRVIVEGMLAGKPVIATRCGGPLEIIDHMHTGILVPPGDAKALADAINSLLSNPDVASQIANKGRKKALASYSMRGMNDLINQEIERVHALSRASGPQAQIASRKPV